MTSFAKYMELIIWVCRCQTYEGGIAGEPGSEAHGGYVSFKTFLYHLYVTLLAILLCFRKMPIFLLRVLNESICLLKVHILWAGHYDFD